MASYRFLDNPVRKAADVEPSGTEGEEREQAGVVGAVEVSRGRERARGKSNFTNASPPPPPPFSPACRY